MERRRKSAAAASTLMSSSSSSSSSSDGKGISSNGGEKNRGGNIPRSWAQNLSRSYTDLQQEYQLRKDYFKQRYEADYDDHVDWDDDEEDDLESTTSPSSATKKMEHLAVGTSSYYKQRDVDDDFYSSDEDPKYVLFRHLLREWCVAGGDSGKIDQDVVTNNDTSSWPRKWSPNEEGYYENGRLRQVTLMNFPSQIPNSGGLSIRDMIRREFRAPSVEERLRAEKEKEVSDSIADKKSPSSSSKEITTRASTIYPPHRILTMRFGYKLRFIH